MASQISIAADQVMPALFIGHGSPQLAVEDSEYRRGWVKIAKALPRPKAVLCISAHWTTHGTFVSGADRPSTIHDFLGFSRELYEIEYPAYGSLDLTCRVSSLLGQDSVRVDHNRGLDHGAWSVLLAMFSSADVPIVQLSLDVDQPPQYHYELARRLAPLRSEGILVLGSGNVVHNLSHHNRQDPVPREWGVRFDSAIRKLIENADHESVVHYEALGRDAAMSVPTPEHFLPLLYVLGATQSSDRISVFNAGVRSAVSMTSYLFEACTAEHAGHA